MKKKIKKYLNLIYIPLSLFIFYILFLIVWKLLGLPSPENLIEIITNYFNKYSLITVFLGALIEGFFIVGQYFPGGFIIFLGVISAGKDAFRASEIVCLVGLAFFISYSLNYLIGKYGWYKLFLKFGLKNALKNAQNKLKKRGLNSILLSYWEPNIASIMATAAGTLKLPLKNFLIYSAAGILIWESFWGILVFNLGKNALDLMKLGPGYVFLIILIWIGIIILTELIHKKYEKRIKT